MLTSLPKSLLQKLLQYKSKYKYELHFLSVNIKMCLK